MSSRKDWQSLLSRNNRQLLSYGKNSLSSRGDWQPLSTAKISFSPFFFFFCKNPSLLFPLTPVTSTVYRFFSFLFHIWETQGSCSSLPLLPPPTNKVGGEGFARGKLRRETHSACGWSHVSQPNRTLSRAPINNYHSPLSFVSYASVSILASSGTLSWHQSAKLARSSVFGAQLDIYSGSIVVSWAGSIHLPPHKPESRAGKKNLLLPHESFSLSLSLTSSVTE